MQKLHLTIAKFGDLPTANVIQIFNLLNSKFTLKFVDCAFKIGPKKILLDLMVQFYYIV